MALKVSVLIPAAGASSRFKGQKKKQFTDMDGRAVFLRTIEAFANRPDVKQIVIAIPQEDEELFQIKWGSNLGFYGVKYIIGGDHRYETVNKLLAQVKDDEIDLIALHDAVRPCVTEKQLDAVFAAAAKTGAAILAHSLVGTIKKIDENRNISQTVDRSLLWEAQTPQVFKPAIIRQAYANLKNIKCDITDDAQLVEALGKPVRIVESDAGNIKITTNTDIVIAAAILKARPQPKAKGPVGPWAGEQGW